MPNKVQVFTGLHSSCSHKSGHVTEKMVQVKYWLVVVNFFSFMLFNCE